jgi:L-histidine Nalpha-methyltransferase
MTGRYAIEMRLPNGRLDAQLRVDVLRGLTARPKSLPPKWFYDDAGSRLFERITRTPEYYPTRAEREILGDRASAIAEAAGAAALIELGSGSSAKTRVLLGAVAPKAYVAVDVSEAMLREAADGLSRDFPDLAVTAVVADFLDALELPETPGPRLLAFLGGTIGNLTPERRAAFLARMHELLEPGDALLLGTDLVKPESDLRAAYDDADGLTAAFNKNLLAVVNRRLGANFDPDDFDHVARWNPAEEWMEMRLRARRALTVAVDALGLAVAFGPGEDLLTEISAKFRPEQVRSELDAAGFTMRHWWTDAHGRYALSLSKAEG